MPFFKYNGKKTSITAFGHLFESDPVEVTDEHAIGKLRGNRFFDEVEKKKRATKPKPEPTLDPDVKTEG